MSGWRRRLKSRLTSLLAVLEYVPRPYILPLTFLAKLHASARHLGDQLAGVIFDLALDIAQCAARLPEGTADSLGEGRSAQGLAGPERIWLVDNSA